MYTKTLYSSWADMDLNGHMRNTAYLDKAADVRQWFLSDHGFPVQEFVRLRLGPVIMKDEMHYFREIGLQQPICVGIALAGEAPDGSRLILRHDIGGPDGALSARITSVGGWLDHKTRKLVAPPGVLVEAMNLLEKTSDFAVLPSSLRTNPVPPELARNADTNPQLKESQ